MGAEDNWDGGIAMAPAMMMAAQNTEREEEQWRNFNNSVNAVSLGFVATAILISMFLVMAIFERFFRPRSSHLPSTSRTTRFDLQQQIVYQNPKLDHHSPKMTSYAKEVSVVMPGEDIPTFIAHPAPAPCPRERAAWPLHQHKPCLNPSSSS